MPSAAGAPPKTAKPIDASGGLPDGSKFDGVDGPREGAAETLPSCSSAR